MGLIIGVVAVGLSLIVGAAQLAFFFTTIIVIVIPVLVGLAIGHLTNPIIGFVVGGFLAVHFFRKLFK